MADNRIIPVVMPKWGLSMSEGKLTGWLVDSGKRINVGEAILEVETDKIAGAVESGDAGTLRRRVGEPGTIYPVKALLGVIADDSVTDKEIDDYVASYVTPPPEEGEEEAGPKYEFVDLPDGRVRYARRGTGDEKVVLIHGFGGDLDNWLFNAPALASERAVYALDLPGHGGSVKEAHDLVGALREFLDGQGLSTVHLVGHSMGGLVAGQFAAESPERVLSLTLIAPAGLGAEIDAAYIDGFVGATGRKDLKPVLQRLFADPSLVNRSMVDDVLKYKRLDGVQGALETLRDQLFADGRQARSLDLDAYHGPLLVIWGAEDAIIPASHADAAPSRAEVRVLDGVGHSPHMEAAGEVNRLLEGFLAGVRAG
jgi:pyruvate dehydrogenase E2 component (dihydrolipoamide acetyltransferase)